MKDVFVKGDKYFRTGDLLSKDAKGYYFFADRIGDTFRWKGENVSTTEVSEVVSKFPGIGEANVYGVEVLGSPDGRACLAALTMSTKKQKTLEPDYRAKLLVHCKKNLPSYALPLFLRVLAEAGPATETLKQQKHDLRKQGCVPSACKPDVVYWLNPASGAYEELTEKVHKTFGEGKAKL